MLEHSGGTGGDYVEANVLKQEAETGIRRLLQHFEDEPLFLRTRGLCLRPYSGITAFFSSKPNQATRPHYEAS